MSAALEALAEALGVVWRYWDGAGRYTEAPAETLRAVIGALGVSAADDGQVDASLAALWAGRAANPMPRWAVVTAGEAVHIPMPGDAAGWELHLEEGTVLRGVPEGGQAVTGPLPVGYHELRVGAHRVALLSAPRQIDEAPRGWGVMAPLYGLRPVGCGGIGDYADLAATARALALHGGGFVGINPVHAGFAQDRGAFSPYSPSSRNRFATLHIATPGDAPPADGDLIDYETATAAKLAELDRAFLAFEAAGGDPAFDLWRAAEGGGLQDFATHQALSEVHGAYWYDWPEAFKAPDTEAVRAFAAANGCRIRAHAWRQWMAETQLAAAQGAARAAGMAHGLYLDLAVGTHPGGAETWADPVLFARGVSLGAPPDSFAPDAQVWGLAPMLPQVLAARGFAPLALTLRRQLRFCGILRIDHILGFERTFWVPDGLPGAYVTMPKAALLAVARIEAARAGAVIVGEDLGVVPDGLRADLAQANILGCRVAMFERDWNGDGHFIAPEHYPEQVMASFGSHDTPLWRGWRSGRDIDWRERLGDLGADEAAQARQGRVQDVAAFDRLTGGQGGDVIAMFAFIAATRARLAAVQLEDILGAEEQPNLPGTIHDHPNWRRRLSRGADVLKDDKILKQTGAIMARHGR
ncbi:4-alpha-glucanotransferase [Actibacterium sp. D379-3]